MIINYIDMYQNDNQMIHESLVFQSKMSRKKVLEKSRDKVLEESRELLRQSDLPDQPRPRRCQK